MKIFKFNIIIFAFFIFLQTDNLLASSPKKWQTNFQQPATEIMENIIYFHNIMLYVMFGIVFLVTVFLAYIVVRYNKKTSPIPSKVSHNTILEVIWTIVPLAIVIMISIPSIKLLIKAERIPAPDMTIKVIGNQWYWSYYYPEHNDINFDSNMIQNEDLQSDDLRLLSVDNELIVPVNKNIRLIITASDVIHSWSVSALGVKRDAIPGRLNETWFNIKKPGKYYGQCYELCGALHGFMPIVVKAVEEEEFEEWVGSFQ